MGTLRKDREFLKCALIFTLDCIGFRELFCKERRQWSIAQENSAKISFHLSKKRKTFLPKRDNWLWSLPGNSQLWTFIINRVCLLLMSWSTDKVCNLRHFKRPVGFTDSVAKSAHMIYVIYCGNQMFHIQAFSPITILSNYHVRPYHGYDAQFCLWDECTYTKQKILNNEAINPLTEDYDLSNWRATTASCKWRAFCLYEKNGLACVGFETHTSSCPPPFISLNFNNSWPNMRQFGPRVDFFAEALLHWIIFASSESNSNFANETHSFSFLSVLLHFSAFSLYLSRRI